MTKRLLNDLNVNLEVRPCSLKCWLILLWVELGPGGVGRWRQCSEHVHRKLEGEKNENSTVNVYSTGQYRHLS